MWLICPTKQLYINLGMFTDITLRTASSLVALCNLICNILEMGMQEETRDPLIWYQIRELGKFTVI